MESYSGRDCSGFKTEDYTPLDVCDKTDRGGTTYYKKGTCNATHVNENYYSDTNCTTQVMYCEVRYKINEKQTRAHTHLREVGMQ